MTPEQAIEGAKKGNLLPVYLVAGDERHIADQVIQAIRSAATEGGIAGLNDDTMDAPQAKVDSVLSVARTMPMMAKRRFILARNIETWDSEKKGTGQDDAKKKAVSPLDALAAYAQTADPSTILVLVSTKLDKRRKLYTAAKKDGWLISCETPKRHELPGWIIERAGARGNKISRNVADLLAELAGPELASVADALERVCLYSGEGKPVTEEAVSECVIRLRTGTVWELVSAVGKRDAALSLQLLNDVYDPDDRGLRLIGLLGWAARQLIKFDQAIKDGMSGEDAAKQAGAPPFKARELQEQVRKMPSGTLTRWITFLAEADLDLKGGSKRPPRAIMEQMVLDLCRTS